MKYKQRHGKSASHLCKKISDANFIHNDLPVLSMYVLHRLLKSPYP